MKLDWNEIFKRQLESVVNDHKEFIGDRRELVHERLAARYEAYLRTIVEMLGVISARENNVSASDFKSREEFSDSNLKSQSVSESAISASNKRGNDQANDIKGI